MFAITEEGNLITSSCIICFANVGKYSEEILQRLTFQCFENVTQSSIATIVFFTE